MYILYFLLQESCTFHLLALYMPVYCNGKDIFYSILNLYWMSETVLTTGLIPTLLKWSSMQLCLTFIGYCLSAQRLQQSVACQESWHWWWEGCVSVWKVILRSCRNEQIQCKFVSFCHCILDQTGTSELVRHGDIIRLEHKEWVC